MREDKGSDWVNALRKRNIDVRGPLLREEGETPVHPLSRQGGNHLLTALSGAARGIARHAPPLPE